MFKYIRTSEGFTVWPKDTAVYHSHQARMSGRSVISAGFVYWSEITGLFVCNGQSESLQMSSLPEDSKLFNDWIKS